MAVDISNGGLIFGSSLDPAGFVQGANQIIKKGSEIRSEVAKSTKQQQVFTDEMLRAATMARQTSDTKIKAAIANTNAFRAEGLSIMQLNEELRKQQFLAQSTGDTEKIARLNKTIQETQAEISRLQNVGKSGFDELGNKITNVTEKAAKQPNVLNKVWGGLKTIANILPGLGIAGLLAFAIEPISKYLSSLDFFNTKVKDNTLSNEQFTQSLNSPKYAEAIKSIYNLKSGIEEAEKGHKSSKAVIDEYNKSLGEAAGKETTLKGVKESVAKNSGAYIEAILREAYAQTLLADAVKKRIELEDRKKTTENFTDKSNALTETVSAILNSPSEIMDAGEIYRQAAARNRKRAINELEEQNKQGLTDYKKYNADFQAYIKKNGLNFNTDTKTVKGVDNSTQLINQAENLQKRISEIRDKYFRKSLDKDAEARQAINDEFKRLADDAKKQNEKYDAYAKKYGTQRAEIALGKKIDLQQLEPIRKKAVEDLTYSQDTAQAQIAFEKQKQLYADYEEYRTTFDEAAAKKRYGNEVKTYAQLLSGLTAQYEAFKAKAETSGLAPNEKARFEQAKKNTQELQAIEDKRFANALQATQTYIQKAKAIDEEYESQKQALYDAEKAGLGEVSEEQLKILAKQREDKKKAINEENAYAKSGYAELLENIDVMTRQQVIEALDKAKKVYEEQYAAKLITAREYQEKINLIEGKKTEIQGSDSFSNIFQSVKKYQKILKSDLPKDSAEAKKAQKEMFDAIGEGAADASSVVGAVASSFQELGIGGEGLQDALKGVQGILDGASGIAKGIATGNPVDIITGSIKLLTSAIQLFNQKDKKLQKQIDGYKANLESLQQSYEKLDRAVQNSVGESIYADQAAQIENLKRQQQELIKARDAESQKKKADQGKIDEYNSQINAIPGKIEDISNAISQNLIQGTFKDLSNALADALTDAFKSGEDGLAAMDKSFNAFIGNAIKNSLKLKLIEPIIKSLTDDLVKYAKGNGNSIVGFDFSSYKTDLQNAGKTFTDALDANKEFFQDTASASSATKANTLSGAIKGITEEQADLLAGQFGGLRIAQLETNNQLKAIVVSNVQIFQLSAQKLEVLNKIETNTSETAVNTQPLKEIKLSLENIDRKMNNSGNTLAANGLKTG